MSHFRPTVFGGDKFSITRMAVQTLRCGRSKAVFAKTGNALGMQADVSLNPGY